jgi:hypothetical protein
MHACVCIHTVDYTLQVDPELRPNKDERERLDTIINSHSLGDHLKMLVLILYNILLLYLSHTICTQKQVLAVTRLYTAVCYSSTACLGCT